MTALSVADSLVLYRVNPTGEEIGRGAYGRVFEVDYEGTFCAAKEIHSLLLQYSRDDEVSKIKENFIRECQIWSGLRHPFIVQFLGVYYPKVGTMPVMVMEKMLYSLRQLVEKYSNLPVNIKLNILDEVCLGLRYLHTRNPPIVHCDLTPNNILLSSFLEAKISDLGVARALKTTSRTMTLAPGTADFMPPESLADRPVYGLPLDVFSYGGVVLFTVTGLWPQPSSWVQFDPETGNRTVLSEVQRRQQYLQKIIGSATELKPLVISCLDDNPKTRPSVAEVSMSIKTVKEASQMNSVDGKSVVSWLAEQESSSPSDSNKQQQEQHQITKQSAAAVSGPTRRSANIEWKEGSPSPVGHSAHTAVFLDGKIYIGGGEKQLLQPLYQIDVYDVDNDSWGSSIDTQFCYFSMTTLNNNLIVAGGTDHEGDPTNQIFILNNHLLKMYAKMKRPRCCAAAVGHQGKLLMVGGKFGTKVLCSTELYDSQTGEWSVCEILPQPHYWLQSAVVNNTVYFLGGFGEDHNYSLQVFSARLDGLSSHKLQWNSEKHTLWGRSAPASVFGSHSLLFGGVKKSAHGYVCTKNVYMLNDASHDWELVGHTPSTRDGLSVVNIAEDKVVVFGGVNHADKAKYTNTVWIGLCS